MNLSSTIRQHWSSTHATLKGSQSGRKSEASSLPHLLEATTTLDPSLLQATFPAAYFGSMYDTDPSLLQATFPAADCVEFSTQTPFGSMYDHEMEHISGGDMSDAPVQPKLVLSLAQTLPQPHPGSEELPSVGSADHWSGQCRPCAFTHKGCSAGINCSFCHLCDPGEKKRRRKDKVAYLRSVRRWKKENG